ncbi:MAG: 4-hydroxy-3-methylbut-2-en-1-yl diphosphate synthase [Bacteroidales bacterium]
MDIFNYIRRPSRAVNIGEVPLGADFPIRVQSMTDTSTRDISSSVQQILKISIAGADYVRLTTQGIIEVDALKEIRSILREKGNKTPLIADIHFNPNVADAAAKITDKIRINPGNFIDNARIFKHIHYDDKTYQEEIDKLRARFIKLLDICKANKTALRIGVNHGSLSDRIMSRYGDTPEGIVESCMEFLRICKEENFNNTVISIKASNTFIMVKSVRLLTKAMEHEDINYPLHLGVTEAGEGEDGRIKSAVGIGALLADGIGDTIRVSLSEPPENEIPVAIKLANYIASRTNHPHIDANPYAGYTHTAMERYKTKAVDNIGGKNTPVVIYDASYNKNHHFNDLHPDYIYAGKEIKTDVPNEIRQIVDYHKFKTYENSFPLFTIADIENVAGSSATIKFLKVEYTSLSEAIIETISTLKETVIVATSSHKNSTGEIRAIIHTLIKAGIKHPIVLMQQYKEDDKEELQIKSGADFGTILLDGFGDGILISNQGNIPAQEITDTAFSILQATRLRITKTEYISCPGCGRTQFDLQKTIAEIKAATTHLIGLKIGIMGCIVNGPGEMADADYGYVGAARGRISLYKGKECIEKNIPEAEAVKRLLQFIEKEIKKQ